MILLLFGSVAAAIPFTPAAATGQFAPHSSSLASALDPDGTTLAFNVTYAQFDLYAENAAVLSFTNTTHTSVPGFPPDSHTWFSKVNRTQDGTPVAGTGFNHTIPAAGSGMLHNQTVIWVLQIPKGNYSEPFLRFSWNGTLGKGTTARYRVLNETSAVQFERTHTGNFTGGPPANATLPCRPSDECLNVAKYIGQTLTLVFDFNSNSTGAGLKVQMVNIIVASVSVVPKQSFEHTMTLNPANSTEVIHSGKITLKYNSTEKQPSPPDHTFNQTATIFYLPSSYIIDSINLNETNIYNAIYNNATAPIDLGTCNPLCKGNLVTGNRTSANTRYISLNMSYIGAFSYSESLNSTALITVRSTNAISSVTTTLQRAPTTFWIPGDSVGVMITNRPGVDRAGPQNVTFTDPSDFTFAPWPNPVDLSVRAGISIYNFTLPLSPLGDWTVNATFLSGYDYGVSSSGFRVEQMGVQTGSLQMSGGAGRDSFLNIGGKLIYSSNSSDAKGVNVTAFAVDAGSPPGPISSTGPTVSGRLFISEITLANGVFTQNKALILFFTVTNPDPSTAFDADVTIEHEWHIGLGGPHGSNVTFPLTLGDEPFQSPSFVYRMDVSITSNGFQITVRSVATNNRVTHTLSAGTSGVSPLRQHFGSFKVSVASTPSGGSPTTSPLVTSPTYSYVLASPLTPSRLLAVSPTVFTASNGTFSTSIAADKILGARNLLVFVLARDANGIVLGKDQTMTVTDSTLLTPTADIPGEVTVKQSVTVILNLRSNSTNLPITLTVNLDLSGSGTVATKTITIQPGTTQPAEFTFTAPAAAGSYLLTFSSPQYGAPLLPKTLNVVLLQSSLQILIPAIIGLVAALAILGFYLIRKQPETEMEEEKKRPSPGKPSKPQQGSSGSKSLTRS